MTSRPRRVASSETAPCLPSTVHWRNSHSPTTQIASSKETRKETKPEERIHTHKEREKHHTRQLTALPFLAAVCAFARWRLFAAEPRILEVRIDSTPTSRFLHRQVGLCPRDNGRALRSAMSSMSQQLATFQLRKSAHSDMPRKARNLLKGVSVRAFVKKSAIFMSVGI